MTEATTEGSTVNKESGREFLSFSQARRIEDRREWEAYWKYREKEVEGTWIPKWKFKADRFLDRQVTWFREKIVEPLHDKNKLPYYHRKINRVPDVDQCGVHDKVCLHEAEEQFRLDKLVDHYILQILYKRAERCLMFWGHDHLYYCAKQFEDYEHADLNNFIKYGELGSEQSVLACYMKQKHRLIWERRHPEIMEERKRAYEEHVERLKDGKFDMRFWNKLYPWQDKRGFAPHNIFEMHWKLDKLPMEGDQPISKDWRYYRKLEEDPDFDSIFYSKKQNAAAKKQAEKWRASKGSAEDGNGDSTSTKEEENGGTAD